MRVGFMFTLESPKRLDKAVKVPGGASFVIVTIDAMQNSPNTTLHSVSRPSDQVILNSLVGTSFLMTYCTRTIVSTVHHTILHCIYYSVWGYTYSGTTLA